jgi:hypothetical protein
MDIFINLKTAVVFTAFFTVFLISSCFWGRLILKALGIKDDCGYGNPVALVAFLSVFILLSSYIALFTHSLDPFLFTIFVLGIVGFVIEFIVNLVKNNNQFELKKIIKDNRIILVPISISLVLSFCYSFRGITGGLEPWWSENADYFNWILLADYWKGDFKPEQFSVTNMATILREIGAFGTEIFFAFFASANGKTSFFSSLGFLIVLYSIIGSFVYLIVYKLLKLQQVLALIISILLVVSTFMVYLGFMGFYGHLFGLFCYLNCIYAIAHTENVSAREYFFKLLFPILLLYMGYQGAFIFFVFMVFCFMCINFIFKYKELYINQSENKFFLIKKEFLPFFIAILISLVIVPQMIRSFITRSIYSVIQESGFGLTLLDPLLFTGIPLENDTLQLRRSNASLFTYLIDIVIVIIIFALNSYFKNKNTNPRREKYQLKSLFYMFLFSVILYLVSFSIKGDIYQVWKLASYVILPLAFIPTSLLVLLLANICNQKKKLFFVLIAAAIAMVLTPKIASSILSYDEQKNKSEEYRSVLNIYNHINQYKDIALTKDKIVFDFDSDSINYFSALASESWESKIYFREQFYLIPSNADFISFMDKDTVFLTNINYKGMYGSEIAHARDKFEIYVYDYDDILNRGMVVYANLERYSAIAVNQYIALKFLLPEKYQKLDTVLKVDFNTNLFKDASCYKAMAYVDNSDDTRMWEINLDKFEFPIMAQNVHNGIITVVINLLEFKPTANYRLPTSEINCVYQIEKIYIEQPETIN